MKIFESMSKTQSASPTSRPDSTYSVDAPIWWQWNKLLKVSRFAKPHSWISDGLAVKEKGMKKMYSPQKTGRILNQRLSGRPIFCRGEKIVFRKGKDQKYKHQAMSTEREFERAWLCWSWGSGIGSEFSPVRCKHDRALIIAGRSLKRIVQHFDYRMVRLVLHLALLRPAAALFKKPMAARASIRRTSWAIQMENSLPQTVSN